MSKDLKVDSATNLDIRDERPCLIAATECRIISNMAYSGHDWSNYIKRFLYVFTSFILVISLFFCLQCWQVCVEC